ncbi:MAG: PilZ domain-containing protein [Gammaproteobacteria bacterium]
MSDESINQQPQKRVLSVSFLTPNELYLAYMPFIKRGGLFIATNETYVMGEEVFMLLKLLDEPKKYPLVGTVVWLTPRGAQGGMRAGIGVQFDASEDAEMVRKKIETYLAGTANSERRTDTM